jgi:hypothetical protein
LGTEKTLGCSVELVERARKAAPEEVLRAPIIEIEPLSGSRSVRRSPPHRK